MDYFSELLESYSKLKKRTYKLTYICEEDGGGSEGELVGILSQAPVGDEFVAMPGDQYPALARFKYRKSTQTVGKGRNMKPSQKVIVTQGGYSKASVLDDDGNLSKDEGNKKMLEMLLKAMAGEEPPQTGAEAADAAAAAAAEAEETAQLEASYNFLKPDKETGQPRYSTDPNDPANANRAIKSLQGTINKLVTYCDKLGDKKTTVKWCDKAGSYIAGKGTATLTYKLTNGIGVGPDGEQTPIPADLIADVAENHEDFLSFLTDPPLTDEDKAERCASMNEKVGFYNNKLMFFGKGRDSEGKINNGIAINFSEKNKANPLYADALNKVKEMCGGEDGAWQPENKVVQSLDSAGINGIRGTVNEKCLQIAVKLSQPGLTDKEKKEVLKDLARYIYEKREALIQYAKGQPPNTEAVGEDLKTFVEGEFLMEQHKLGKEDGGAALVRYTLSVIRQHQQFVTMMGADDARDAAKEGGTGSRADTVLVYKGDNAKARAEAAAKKIGLDPKTAVIPAEDGSFEIGVGQKDKKGGIGGLKMGEFNSTPRRRAAIRGEITDDGSFDSGFQEWAFKGQFGDNLDASAEASSLPPPQGRFQRMLAFEEDLESSVANAMDLMENGKDFVDKNGNPKSQSAETILGSIGRIVKEALPYFSETQTQKRATNTELASMFYDGKTDFSDAAARAKAAESVGRQIRVQKVMDALNNPESDEATKQAAKDWIIRNAMMVGGNANDMTQLQTSYREGRAVAMNHNKIFEMMNDPTADVQFSARPGDSTINITVNGLKMSLGTERTSKGGKPVTRTVLNMPKATFLDPNVSKELTSASGPMEEPQVSSDEAPQEESTLHSFIRSQMQLFEQFLNSSK